MAFLDDLQKSVGMFQEMMTQAAVKKAVGDATDQAQKINATMTDELERRQALYGLSQQLGQQFLSAGLSPQQAAQGASLFQPQQAASAEQAFAQGDINLAQRLVGFEDYAAQVRGSSKRAADIERQDEQFAQQEKMQAAQFKQQEKMQAAQFRQQEKLRASQQMGAGEQSKAELKDAMLIKKENRKERRELDKAEQSLIAQKQMLERASRQFEKYSESSIAGTGPLATGFGLKSYVGQETESLNSAFKNISFDTLIKSFQGMSRAVDSDVERRAFEATQPSIELDDATNRQLLADKLNAVNSLLIKTQKAKETFDKHGAFVEPFPRKVFNPATGDEATVYNEQQLQKANAKGFK